jgi:antitoxin (DNA-binding transcriptional repressor) of toxin-antitoxin stability system
MKTATVSDLRNDFPRLSKWLEKGETIQLLKRGKPFARVVPEPKPGSLLGSGRGTAVIHGEFDALIDEGIKSGHFPLTDSVWKGIRQRGTKLARKTGRG